MVTDIGISRENDAGDVDYTVDGCFWLWRCLSRLERWRSTNGGPADVEVIYRPP